VKLQDKEIAGLAKKLNTACKDKKINEEELIELKGVDFGTIGADFKNV
jgi:hypothetical protein